MEKLQTAVEWIYQKLQSECLIDMADTLFEQAKEMEKDQIMRAYMSGEIGEMYELKNTLTAKQYYENNYEKTN